MHFKTGNSFTGGIVSISKSYIHHIVREKEIKKGEFGAKVNLIRFDGINFIEHLSFGTEKQHYSLDKIKAPTELNEILPIFCGIHMSNAVKIAKRLALEKLKENKA